MRSKDTIHVILKSEDHKAIPAQVEIRSQILKKEMCFLRLQRTGQMTLKKLFNALITIMPTSVEPDRAFSAMEPICYKTQEQNE